MMNELIREFVRESHLDVYGLGKERYRWEYTVEKFTEAIALKCADIIKENKRFAKDHKWSSRELADVCVFEIEKTFGVENGKETVSS
jgi:acyl carrier protein